MKFPAEVVYSKTNESPFLLPILTQLFGGSAGREAPAVQLSGALIDHLSHILKISEDNRKICLIASIGAALQGCLACLWQVQFMV